MTEVALFSLILMRMSGFVFFNPILGRRNIPQSVQTGLTLVLALNIFTYSAGAMPELAIANNLEYMVLLLRELIVGFCIGYVMNLFFMIATYAGAVIDYEMGMSMATVYDPGTNLSVSVNSNVLFFYMFALFLAGNGHLLLIKILIESADILPYGQIGFNPQLTYKMIDIFTQCIGMVMRLVFPIIATELLLEVGVGVIMKMIPQLNVFVVNIQLKIVIGLMIILFMISPMQGFMNEALTEMLGSIGEVLQFLR